MTITQTDIADAVAKRLDQSDMVINEIFTALIREMRRQLEKGYDIELANFGKFIPCWGIPSVELFITNDFEDQLHKLEDKEN